MEGLFTTPAQAAARFRSPDAYVDGGRLFPSTIRQRITQWLLDAFALGRVGIPAESFTFVLEAGLLREYFADYLQQRLHKEIAWYRAFRQLTEDGCFEMGPYHRFTELTMITEEEVETTELLANGVSPILRSDFNTGIPLKFDAIVDETRSPDIDDWMTAWHDAVPPSSLEQPTGTVHYNVRLADNYELRTD
jgi:hypothetical protein